MTGAELAAIRKTAGLSQAELGSRAGIGRHAVSYWECKPQVDRRAWAVKRISDVLGLSDAPRMCEGRFVWPERVVAGMIAGEAAFAAMVSPILASVEAAKADRRVRCGAKTRTGKPCQMKSEPGKRRCKFHGGKSTGARTPEGKARIAEAQRRRWTKWRVDRRADDCRNKADTA